MQHNMQHQPHKYHSDCLFEREMKIQKEISNHHQAKGGKDIRKMNYGNMERERNDFFKFMLSFCLCCANLGLLVSPC
jgi:hypothetical protein